MTETKEYAIADGSDDKDEKVTSWFNRQFRAPEGVAKSRMAICQKCEHFSAVKMCKVCKCLMPAKVHIAASQCPEGKWGKFVRPRKR